MFTSAITRGRIPTLLFVLAMSFPTTLVHAQEEPACPDDVDGCHEEDVAFHWREGILDAVMLDTGWVPSGSPLQVRFAVYLGGETEIDLAGTSLVWWAAPLSIAVPGTPESGLLTIDYGLEIVARIKIDVSIAGTHYRWEGDIPTGGIPTDLRLAALSMFDSMLLPPQTPRPIEIADTTDRYRVIDADLSSIVSIPGISGGFAVDVGAALAAGYRTERIEIGDAPTAILEEGAFVVAGSDEGETGFGASKDVVITPVGQLDYDGSIEVFPEFFIELLGRRFDLGLPSIAIPVVDVGREVRFDSVTVHVPLPDVRVEPRSIDFGDVALGDAVTELLEIRNEGELELVVTPRSLRAPFAVSPDPIVVAPRAARMVELSFEPTEAGVEGAMLFLETNDPDESLVVVRLTGTGIGPSGDGGVSRDAGTGRDGTSTDGGCGCRVGAARSSAPVGLLVVIGLALAIRRRRA